MRQWLVNLLFLCLAVAAGVQLFVLKYQVMDKEEELKMIHRQILNDSREVHMLKADWALLNDPDRLRELVKNQTNFRPIGAGQIVHVETLPLRMTPPPVKKPDFRQSEQESS